MDCVIISHQVLLSKAAKHWDGFVSHCSLMSVSGYKGFHMFVKLSLMNEQTKDPFLFLPMSLDVKLELLNRE